MKRSSLETLALCAVCALALACGGDKKDGGGETSGGNTAAPKVDVIPVQKAADMLHAVMEADRTSYTRHVVNRLTKEQQVMIVNPDTKESEPFGASEQWKSEHGKIPLPAQMFREGAELVGKNPSAGFTYVLLSPWPINKKNKPRTEVERQGLDAVANNGGKAPFYGTEDANGQKYFVAVYADMAVAPACVDCHNAHKDSPKTDFKLDDVMGGVVIRIPM